jgi:hypothetical protein
MKALLTVFRLLEPPGILEGLKALSGFIRASPDQATYVTTIQGLI